MDIHVMRSNVIFAWTIIVVSSYFDAAYGGSCSHVTRKVGGYVELPCEKSNVVWSYVSSSGSIDVISRNFSLMENYALRIVQNGNMVSYSLVIFNLTPRETREYRCTDEKVAEDDAVCYSLTVQAETVTDAPSSSTTVRTQTTTARPEPNCHPYIDLFICFLILFSILLVFNIALYFILTNERLDCKLRRWILSHQNPQREPATRITVTDAKTGTVILDIAEKKPLRPSATIEDEKFVVELSRWIHHQLVLQQIITPISIAVSDAKPGDFQNPAKKKTTTEENEKFVAELSRWIQLQQTLQLRLTSNPTTVSDAKTGTEILDNAEKEPLRP